MLFISGRQQTSGGQELTEVLAPLLDEVARNDTLRSLAVAEDPGAREAIEEFLGKRLTNPALGFSVEVCALDVPCGLTNHPDGVRDIFVAERVISSTLQQYQPRRIKLFLWEQPI
jgi:hypothetical protein